MPDNYIGEDVLNIIIVFETASLTISVGMSQTTATQEVQHGGHAQEEVRSTVGAPEAPLGEAGHHGPAQAEQEGGRAQARHFPQPPPVGRRSARVRRERRVRSGRPDEWRHHDRQGHEERHHDRREVASF